MISSPICKQYAAVPSARQFHKHELRTTGTQIYAKKNDSDDIYLVPSTATSKRPRTATCTTLVVLTSTTAAMLMMISQNALAYDETVLGTVLQDMLSKGYNSPTSPQIRYLIAGGGCAALSHGIATPLDVIKTKMQADRKTFNTGFVNAAVSIVKNGRMGVLLSGLVPTLLGYGVEGAVKFGMYESLKPALVALFHTSDKTIPYLFASVGAGAAASLLLVPMERSRIEVVTSSNSDSDSRSNIGEGITTAISISNQKKDDLLVSLKEMIHKEGISTSLFYGYNTMLLKQVPYTMTKQVSFDVFATTLCQCTTQYNILSPLLIPFDVEGSTQQAKFFCTTTAAFLASILACMSSQPGDVLLTKIYNNKDKGQYYTAKSTTTSCGNCISMLQNMYSEEGFQGLFAGMSARFAHVAIIVISQLLLYDYLKQLLGLPPTVSDC
mmetsp:Transcript_5969/g.11281  ORF Transcript_5969/g.11281 Transcript_5969/m.11281 type:complete len:439 (-) Transcript_5969:63-1379(-)